MSKGFYRAFEERYYAPREVITALRKQYLPFVRPLKDIYENAKVFDIGCGRGEWLCLMKEMGFEVLGVDLDAGMLQDCWDRNLPVMQGDAVAYLKTLENESRVVISAFHVVEHIPFEDLTAVVVESLRVLKPGGLLIMETPNPENIVVATRNFYLDPTHQRPIPPQLLSFLAEYYGFGRVKTLRLQEHAELSSNKSPSLLNVLSGVSPDYTIVAQKITTPEQMRLFDAEFEKEYGLSLETLAQHYESRIARTEGKVEYIETAFEQIRSTPLWRILRWMYRSVKNIKKGLK
jgi:SAM-dependent methyltransferase